MLREKKHNSFCHKREDVSRVHGLRVSFTCGVWQRQVASQVGYRGDDLRPIETSSVTDTLFVASYNHHHHQAQ